MRNRAWRRAQEKRVKNKVKKYWSCYNQSPRVIGMISHTHKPCSCVGCSRGRKYRKGKDALTIQERRNEYEILQEV